MAKFIEVHRIPLIGGSFRVAETYEELRELIASAQGGIPMGRADG